MGLPVDTAPLAPLPYRARPPQVLLGVGAVLVVSAAAAVGSAYGGTPARALLLALAAAAAWQSLRAARRGLRSSAEVLAACAAGVALDATELGEPVSGSGALLAVVFLGLHLRSPATATWPIAAWVAAQLAVLRGLDAVPRELHTEAFLGVALVGLGIALFARRSVGRTALVTTAPWWFAGVVGGISSTWADDGGRQWFSAVLMIAAGLGLVLARLREPLDPLLGPPRLMPVVAGVVIGTAVTGASSSLGPLAMTLTGYAGVLLATLAAAYLTGWHRGLGLPIALAAGMVMAGLCIAQLVARAEWGQLSLLLLLTAVPTVVVALRRPDDRAVALPTAVGCLAGAAVLALPDGYLPPVAAAVALTALYALAMATGSLLDPGSRRATARAAGVCAVASALLLRVEGEQVGLALVFVAQGVCTLVWAWRTGRGAASDDELSRAAWRVGAVQLVLGAWVAAAATGLAAVEWYSLSAAAGLLLTAGPGLFRGSSWAAWGPGLLVAAVPSTLLAVIEPDGPRAVGVLVAAGVVMAAGARSGLRAPLMVGAGTALALAVGVTVRAVPWPVGTALVVGALLLADGVLRERRPVAGFGSRLADLR